MSTIAGKEWYRNTFLQSDEWKLFRTERLLDQGAKCFICGLVDTSNDVHHIWYGEGSFCGLMQFAVLCRICHEQVHWLFEPCGAKNESEKREAYYNFIAAKKKISKKCKASKLPDRPAKKPKPKIELGEIGKCKLCKFDSDDRELIALEHGLVSPRGVPICKFCANSLKVATKPWLYKTKGAYWKHELRNFIALSIGRPDPECIRDLLDENRLLIKSAHPESFI